MPAVATSLGAEPQGGGPTSRWVAIYLPRFGQVVRLFPFIATPPSFRYPSPSVDRLDAQQHIATSKQLLLFPFCRDLNRAKPTNDPSVAESSSQWVGRSPRWASEDLKGVSAVMVVVEAARSRAARPFRMGKEAAKKGGAAGRYYAAKGGENVGCGKRHALFCNHLRMVLFVFGLMGSVFLLDSFMLTVIHHFSLHRRGSLQRRQWIVSQNVKSEIPAEERAEKIMYARLLALASAAVSKNEIRDSIELFNETYNQTSTWRPCSDQGNQIPRVVIGRTRTRSGYILVSANGGLNQQRVAVCNAVAVAALLNANLVIPKFLYSSVWKDTSQFGDIYQEDFFMSYLKNDVDIVKELPSHLQSLDIEAIGSLITDNDIRKESTPDYFLQVVFPLLLKNGVVHFYGFGNRLAFDPLPLDLQKLRCKCNFHALKYVPRIQEIGSLLVRRIREHNSSLNMLDEHLLGKYMSHALVRRNDTSTRPVKYLALHMRFEMDMVAYSLCDFDGGEKERRELQAYREVHFPTLTMQIKNNNSLSPEESRSLGKCPLTPEEAAIMLTALGYSSRTYIYLAGSHIYGGQSRMLPFTRLYPNVITKEDILTPSELAPFKNFSSQLAALDFIACAAADVFAMTDSGSQLSSLVNGYRIYHGQDNAPTIRPNKKRFARILSENRTIQWHDFRGRVRKMVQENQRIIARRKGRSIYRLPRTPGCMCKY